MEFFPFIFAITFFLLLIKFLISVDILTSIAILVV